MTRTYPHATGQRALVILATIGYAPGASAVTAPSVAGIPVEFLLFALTLLGVALLHRDTLKVAVAGLVTITLYKLMFTGYAHGTGIAGLGMHLAHEWVTLANLLGLLLGFALLARHFEESRIPALLPNFLPDDWKGSFVLLAMIFLLSSFLDNIAAAMIGGTISLAVFRGKLHVGYVVAIVAAANAGGAGSVVGDTTTTMMWIAGVHPLEVFEAYIAAGVALVVFGIPAALQQHAWSPMVKDAQPGLRVDWARVAVVALILAAAVLANVIVNTRFAHLSNQFPFIGIAVWIAILAAAPLRKPEWALLPSALKGSMFLISLILCASMMPIESLPAPSWKTALGLGFVSAVFDNIPLTALALKQGGYDWGFLAYAVGFGGSMIWFGSSAGVALASIYPQARSVGLWLRHGWHVAIAYVIGFFVLLLIMGWHPHDKHAPRPAAFGADLAHQTAAAADQGIRGATPLFHQ